MTHRWRVINLLLAAFCISLGYGMAFGWQWALLGFIVGIAGWIILWKMPHPPGTVVFLTFLILAVSGILQGASLWFMLPSVVFSLAFWDLDALMERLRTVQANEGTQRLEKLHLSRLFPALIFGLLLGWSGMIFLLRLSLGWAILLALVMIISLLVGLGSWYREV
jgi:hypothetical protein